MHEKGEATTEKAFDLVKMLVEKVKRNKPLDSIKVPITKKALVIGGGIAGIQASLDIANAGHKVILIEKDPSIGGHMGFRGPFGNTFPIDEWKGKNLLFIAGGIALPPMRCVIWNALDLRENFKDITIVYGAKSVNDLVYKHELKEWEERPDVKLVTTVDPGGETPDWKGEIGFVPSVVEKTAPSPENTIAIVCGPPIMIKFTFPVLEKLGFKDDQIYTTLENRMKCGVGKCGRCNVGKLYVCKDGPVFSKEQLNDIPAEEY